MALGFPPPTATLGTGSASEIIIGTGTSNPAGVDCVIEYPGLIMNNRKWLDTIVINAIDGLSDPEIRDDREPNPQEDGETPGDAFYGGRTLVLKGFIRAFTLDKLRDIQSAIKLAFSDISTEKPLIFHGKTYDTSVQINCKKFAEISIVEEQNRDDMFIRSLMITVRASNPRFKSLTTPYYSEQIGHLDNFSVNDISDYTFLAGSGSLSIAGSKLVPSTTGNKIFRYTNSDNWSNPLVMFDYSPDSTFTASRVGARLRYINSNNYLWAYIGSDGVMHAGKVDGGVSTEFALTFDSPGPVSRSSGNNYRVSFHCQGNVIYLRHGTTPNTSTVVASYTLTGGNATKFGNGVEGELYADITPGSTAWRYDTMAFAPRYLNDESITTLINLGDFKGQAVFMLEGPMSGPILFNEDTDQSIVFKSTAVIPEGETWTIDIGDDTIIDSLGDSQMGQLDPTSDWIDLAPGNNSILLTGGMIDPALGSTLPLMPNLSTRHSHAYL